MNAELQEEKHYVPGSYGGQLYLNRIRRSDQGPVVFMLHGFGSSSEVFAQQETGLAYYLAQFGFDVYVADLMARGKSRPHLSRTSQYQVKDIIEQDLPALIQTVQRTSHKDIEFVICEGYGSAWFLSALAKHPDWAESLRGLVHYGGYRFKTSADSVRTRIRWTLARLTSLFTGILPLNFFNLGLCDETLSLWQDYKGGTRSAWVDADGQNLLLKLQQMSLPKSLYFSSAKDHLGTASDVRYLIHELGIHHARLIHLGKTGGSLRNYRHFTMLMHDDALVDHFPLVLDWLTEQHGQADQ